MLKPRKLSIFRYVGRVHRTNGPSVCTKRFQTSTATKEVESIREAAETPIGRNLHEELRVQNTSVTTPVQTSTSDYETIIRQVEQLLSSTRERKRNTDPKIERRSIATQAKLAFAALDNALSLGKHPSPSLLESLLRIAHYSQDAGQNSLIMSLFEKYWIPLSAEMIEYAGSHLSYRRRFKECLDFYEKQIKGSRVVTHKAWDTLIIGALRNKQHEIALQILKRVDQLSDHAARSAHSRISLSTYYDALVAFADHHYLPGMQWVWNRSIRSGQLDRIDLGACTKVLNACGRSGLPILATEVMQYISRIGCEPATYNYASLIESYCVAGDVKNAFTILGIMRQEGHRPTSVCAMPIVRFLATDSDLVDRAFFTLQDAHAAGQTIDTVAFNAVIDASVLLRDLSRAVATYQEHESLGVKPNFDTLNSLITGCVGAENKMLALSLVAAFREKHEIVAGSRTFERLIFVCLLQDDYEDAFKYLEEMKEEGHQPSIRVYSLIIRRCIVQGDPRAKLAYEEMKGWGYRHRAIDKLFTDGPDVRRPVVSVESTGVFDRLLSFTETNRWFKPIGQVNREAAKEATAGEAR